MTPAPNATGRQRLDRDRVVTEAVAMADHTGIDSLSMRNLAAGLGVVPMALYKHVANKDELLDAMIDTVFAEAVFSGRKAWLGALKERAISMRRALLRHRWAIGLMESGTPGPANLAHHEAVMGCLRASAGLDLKTAVHAYSLMDAYIYGFTLQERSPRIDIPEEAKRRLDQVTLRQPAATQDYPYLAEVVEELARSGYDLDREFEFGLDRVLEAVAGLGPSRPRRTGRPS